MPTAPDAAPDPRGEPTLVTARDAAALAHVTYRQLDYWAREGYLRPEVPAQGSGSRRGYSFRDVVQLAVIKTFTDAGLTIDTAKAVTDELSKIGVEALERCFAIGLNDGTAIVVDHADAGDTLLALTRQRKGTLSILAINQLTTKIATEMYARHPDQAAQFLPDAKAPHTRGL